MEHRRAAGSNKFALAIIDGDGAVVGLALRVGVTPCTDQPQFTDSLLALGRDGGSEAAQNIYTALRNQLRTTYPEGNVADWSIVVQLVLNLYVKSFRSCISR
jgi:hypothetical protein